MGNTTNLDQLTQAGVIDANQNYSQSELSAIENLTQGEVNALISAHGKLGSGNPGNRLQIL